MKKFYLMFLLTVLLFSCNEKKTNIEVLKNYDGIYISQKYAQKPTKLVNDNEKQLFESNLKAALSKINTGKKGETIYFPIGYRLYIGKSGKVEKIMEMQSYLKGYIKGFVRGVSNDNIFGNVNVLTNALMPVFENLNFEPAELFNKKTPSRIDLKIIGIKEPDGTIKFGLNNRFNFDEVFNSKYLKLNNEYFVAVEEMPAPIGGIQGIQKRLKYPEIAKRAGIEGRVFIKAYINEKGDVDATEVIKGIGAGCDEAAIKAVKETKFIPGRQRGKPVKVQVSIPILFKLNGSNIQQTNK